MFYKLQVANFMRETTEFRELVTNFTRENREENVAGHCIKERARSSPKPCSGRLITTVLTEDLRDGTVGDFRDGMAENFGDGTVRDFGDCIRDAAIGSGSSDSEADSGNMEQLWEEGDVFFAGGSSHSAAGKAGWSCIREPAIPTDAGAKKTRPDLFSSRQADLCAGRDGLCRQCGAS